MAKEKEEQEEVEREMEAALDWDSSDSFDAQRGTDDVEDVEEPEEQDDDAAVEDESYSEDVATEDDEESSESDDSDGEYDEKSQTFTLDGKKYTANEIAANPKLLSKMATHYNQVGNFQKLLDEERGNVSAREEQIKKLEAEKNRIEREWIQRKMEEENHRRAQEQEKSKPAPPQRPQNKILQTQLKPYIDKLKDDGRLTEDEIDEHSGLIAEYIYDYANLNTVVTQVASQLSRRIEQIEQFVNPAIQGWNQENSYREELLVQRQAAEIEGYEDLADQETWEKLKGYISRKIANSPKGKDGKPIFDPVFDAETMAEQYDAMTGSGLRKTLSEVKKRTEKQKKEDVKRAGGSATTGGRKPVRKPKPKSAPSEGDAALDWGDGRYAG